MRAGAHSTINAPSTGPQGERASVSVDDALVRLRAEDLIVAPHVAHRLATELGGDPVAIVEVARTLSAPQRTGARSLPDPLPLTSAVATMFADVEPGEEDFSLLVAAAVCADDRVDGLLAFAQKTAEELAANGASALIDIAAGRFWFRDPRARIWAHGTATLAQRTAVHAGLSHAYATLGDDRRAGWHRCLADLEGGDREVPFLLSAAAELLHEGRADCAFRVAREAALRASEPALTEAWTLAGAAALACGCLDDAAELFENVVATRSEARDRVLPSFTVARTVGSGHAPARELLLWRPRRVDTDAWVPWGHAAGLVAALCAERGARAESREWLGHVREAARHQSGGGVHRDPAEAWTLFLLGEMPDPEQPVCVGTLSGTVYRALRAGIEGDPAAGIRLLRDGDALDEVGSDPLAAGFERTPIVVAYRAIAESLLWLWSGDLRTARDRLAAAAEHCPIALPFAGLGVSLLRRLDVGIAGRTGPLAQALADVLPPMTRVDMLVDRAIAAYLDGDTAAAVTQLSLWAERGAPQGCFALPGLDELAPSEVPMPWEPFEAGRARRLRERVRAARATARERELAEVVEESRRIASPFERARVESALGTAYLLSEEFLSARAHLEAARCLFDEAGAAAWQRATEARLARLDDAEASANRVSTGPVATLPAGDPLDRCRRIWALVLTERELEVAMLIASGSSNREIADRLGISVRTVEVHAARAFGKLDVRSRSALTVLAYRTGHHV